MAKLPVFLIVGGIFLSAMSLLVGLFIIPNQIKQAIVEITTVERGSLRHDSWVEPPVPLYMKIYLFNVTNPKEVMKKGAKPNLQQLGPYVYRQIRKKVDIHFNENGTVFYRLPPVNHFQPEMSNGSLQDIVTMINAPFVGATAKASKMGTFTKSLVAEIFNQEFPNEQMYVTKTVDEMLFKGYVVPFMKDLSNLNGAPLLPNNTFGLYYGRNGTDDGIYEIHTGSKNVSLFGKVASWNYNNVTTWFNEPLCDQISGSQEAMFPPFVTEDRILELFTPGMCSTLKFTFEEKSEIHGIPCHKFTLAREFLADPKDKESNACYWENKKKEFDKNPDMESRSGVRHMAACKQGAPMVMSQPHFYGAAPYYGNQVNGLDPHKEKHDMMIFLEDNTGISTKVRIRIQMNMEVERNKYFRALKKVPNLVHPMFWIEQGGGIDEENAQRLKGSLLLAIGVSKIATWILFAIGGVMALVGILIFSCSTANGRKKSCDIEPKMHNMINVKTSKGEGAKQSATNHYTAVPTREIKPSTNGTHEPLLNGNAYHDQPA